MSLVNIPGMNPVVPAVGNAVVELWAEACYIGMK